MLAGGLLGKLHHTSSLRQYALQETRSLWSWSDGIRHRRCGLQHSASQNRNRATVVGHVDCRPARDNKVVSAPDSLKVELQLAL